MSELKHYGVLGMKWGVRKDKRTTSKQKKTSRQDRKLSKQAKKDASEWSRAKVSTGEGSGNRRKQINAIVNQRSKDSATYKKYFDEYVQNQDMNKHVKKAKRERKVRDAKNTTAKTTRSLTHLILKDGAPVAASIALVYYAATKTGLDKVIVSEGKKVLQQLSNNGKRVIDFAKSKTKK